MARHSIAISQVCRLHPHPQGPSPDVVITASLVWRQTGVWTLTYLLLPAVESAEAALDEQIIVPCRSVDASGNRCDRLWEHTCFEAFFARPDSPAYWELNVAPTGDWNLYGFSDYRQGQTTMATAEPPTVSIHRVGAGLQCTIALDARGFWPDDAIPWAGLTMVAEAPTGSLSYWALSHPGQEADFHDRRSFLVP